MRIVSCTLQVTVATLAVLALAGCHNNKQTAKVVVPPPPAPPAAPGCTLTAEPTTIQQGQSATLSWVSSNTTGANLEPELGKEPASGSAAVRPNDSTTYTMTVNGPRGSRSCAARLTVALLPSAPVTQPTTPRVSEEQLFDRGVKTAYFDFDRSSLRPDARSALSSDAKFLTTHTDFKFIVEGNCDRRGSEEYNLGLGQRRADAAKDYLKDLGVSPDRIATISYGKDRPACTDSDENCWQRNRNARPVYGAIAR
jgi:peptidoglycan-associated lipoprotein